MRNLRNLGALMGLVGAVGNHGKTEKTDEVVRKALLSEDSEEVVALIHEEKYAISPSCRTCPMPCGNTSDVPLDLASDDSEASSLKRQLVEALVRLVERTEGELPPVVYEAISCLGYDLRKESWEELLDAVEAVG